MLRRFNYAAIPESCPKLENPHERQKPGQGHPSADLIGCFGHEANGHIHRPTIGKTNDVLYPEIGEDHQLVESARSPLRKKLSLMRRCFGRTSVWVGTPTEISAEPTTRSWNPRATAAPSEWKARNTYLFKAWWSIRWLGPGRAATFPGWAS